MGLRLEPKVKQFDEERFEELSQILREANQSAESSDIYWDLDDDENASAVRREFLQVADKLNMELTIRRKRGTKTLQFLFGNPGRRERLSAAEARARILEAMKQSKEPVKKAHVLKKTGLSQATWNLRIRELLETGEVKRQGTRRDATYSIV